MRGEPPNNHFIAKIITKQKKEGGSPCGVLWESQTRLVICYLQRPQYISGGELFLVISYRSRRQMRKRLLIEHNDEADAPTYRWLRVHLTTKIVGCIAKSWWILLETIQILNEFTRAAHYCLKMFRLRHLTFYDSGTCSQQPK